MGSTEGVGKVWGSIENVEEYGYWGNWGIFGSSGSSVKYRGTWKEWGNVLGCGGVRKCFEVRGRWGKMLGYGGYLLTLSPHLNTLPHISSYFHTLLHTPTHFPTPHPTLPHSFHILPNTWPNFPNYQKFSNSPTIYAFSYAPKFYILPHSSPYSTPRIPIGHSYFIIYPIPNFLTFLVCCQISPAIKLVPQNSP